MVQDPDQIVSIPDPSDLSLSVATVPVEISAAVRAGLGPLTASVDRIGVTLRFSFPDNGGNLGPVQLDAAFKPPNGVGLAIDGGGFAGGGFRPNVTALPPLSASAPAPWLTIFNGGGRIGCSALPNFPGTSSAPRPRIRK